MTPYASTPRSTKRRARSSIRYPRLPLSGGTPPRNDSRQGTLRSPALTRVGGRGVRDVARSRPSLPRPALPHPRKSAPHPRDFLGTPGPRPLRRAADQAASPSFRTELPLVCLAMGSARANESIFPRSPASRTGPEGCAEGAPNVPNKVGGSGRGELAPPLQKNASPAYIMSGDMAGDDLPFSGISVTTASVVSTMAAIEAAFWSAERVTLAGSTIPNSNMSTNLSFRAS